MANILLSVGLISSLSISSTKSFFAGRSAGVQHSCRGIYLSKSGELIVNRANRLLDRFLECSTDTHDLTNTLHAATEQATDTAELLEIPTGNLHDDVVQAWFETGCCNSGDGVPDFVQGNVETELGGDESEWVSSGFGSKGRRP